jgi:hypothetical protein
MADLEALLASNRAAADELMATAERAEWARPRAPGKWSAAQVVEHMARSFEEAANAVANRPTKLPTLPRIVRPIAGWLFRSVLRTGTFPKSKTSRALNPMASDATPSSPAEGRRRLEAALAVFERECRTRAGLPVDHISFGRISVEEYVRFVELHTRHHARQIPS